MNNRPLYELKQSREPEPKIGPKAPEGGVERQQEPKETHRSLPYFPPKSPFGSTHNQTISTSTLLA